MPNPQFHPPTVMLELLADGCLSVIASDGGVAADKQLIFAEPTAAAIFVQLLLNQLQVVADERRNRTAAPHAPRSQHERRNPRRAGRAGDAPTAA